MGGDGGGQQEVDAGDEQGAGPAAGHQVSDGGSLEKSEFVEDNSSVVVVVVVVWSVV